MDRLDRIARAFLLAEIVALRGHAALHVQVQGDGELSL